MAEHNLVGMGQRLENLAAANGGLYLRPADGVLQVVGVDFDQRVGPADAGVGPAQNYALDLLARGPRIIHFPLHRLRGGPGEATS